MLTKLCAILVVIALLMAARRLGKFLDRMENNNGTD
jgi:hypothetical protein